jgi:hypothetical protein
MSFELDSTIVFSIRSKVNRRRKLSLLDEEDGEGVLVAVGLAIFNSRRFSPISFFMT